MGRFLKGNRISNNRLGLAVGFHFKTTNSLKKGGSLRVFYCFFFWVPFQRNLNPQQKVFILVFLLISSWLSFWFPFPAKKGWHRAFTNHTLRCFSHVGSELVSCKLQKESLHIGPRNWPWFSFWFRFTRKWPEKRNAYMGRFMGFPGRQKVGLGDNITARAVEFAFELGCLTLLPESVEAWHFFWPSAHEAGPYCGWTKSTSHHLRTPGMLIPLLPTNNGFNHGFNQSGANGFRPSVRSKEVDNSQLWKVFGAGLRLLACGLVRYGCGSKPMGSDFLG